MLSGSVAGRPVCEFCGQFHGSRHQPGCPAVSVVPYEALGVYEEGYRYGSLNGIHAYRARLGSVLGAIKAPTSLEQIRTVLRDEGLLL